MAKEKTYPLQTLNSDYSDQQKLIGNHGYSQTEYSKEPKYARDFHPNRQTLQLFKGQAFRLILTFLLAGLEIGTLAVWRHQGNVSHHSKYYFNAVTTALSLALGLNFLEAFKDMAKVLRWRVLANRRFTVRETDLILGGESLMKLMRLMWESKKKPLTLIVCTIWILLNILAQASVAVISLTYSMDGGTNSTGIFMSQGLVNASNLGCYYYGPNCTNPPLAVPETSQSVAHTFGEINSARNGCPYATDDDIKARPQRCSYFYSNETSEFAYRYVEYNPKDLAGNYPYLTDRIIKSSPGECYEYEVDDPIPIDSTDGLREVFVYNFHNDTYKGSLSIPRSNTAFDSTTYVWNGTKIPQEDSTCGPRCVWLYAFQSRGGGDLTDRPDTIFQCQVMIGDVIGATQPEHKVPDEIARLGAASIALSGRYTTPNQKTKEKVWRQYQLYPWGSDWETNKYSADEVGYLMALFALGSLVSQANLNPFSSQIQGTVPTLGYHLQVHWRTVIVLCGSVALVHVILVCLMLWIARPIIVGGDSNLVTARLLQGLVGRLNGRGTLLDAKEIAEAIEREGPGRPDVMSSKEMSRGKVGYGVRRGREGEAGGMVLELSSEVEVRRRLAEGKYPPGRYL